MLMIKINFSKIEIPVGIKGETFIVQDLREDFADVIYGHCVGIAAHALALKIYKSEGEEEYDENEVKMIRFASEEYTSPSIIDALSKLIGS